MLKLRPSNETPPDKFRFRFGDGHTVHAFDKPDWIDKTKKYATDNNYPVPTVEEMEDQLCRTLSGEWCSGGDEYSFVSPRFTFDDFLRGMKTLGEFFVKDEVIDQGTAESRALICSRCVLNMTIPGCHSCVGLANAVVAIKGAKTTKHDHLLKSCGICHCSNSAAVWIPMKSLAPSITTEHEKKYEQISECWKIKELREYQTCANVEHGNRTA